jgi:hypothetical protein
VSTVLAKPRLPRAEPTDANDGCPQGTGRLNPTRAHRICRASGVRYRPHCARFLSDARTCAGLGIFCRPPNAR